MVSRGGEGVWQGDGRGLRAGQPPVPAGRSFRSGLMFKIVIQGNVPRVERAELVPGRAPRARARESSPTQPGRDTGRQVQETPKVQTQVSRDKDPRGKARGQGTLVPTNCEPGSTGSASVNTSARPGVSQALTHPASVRHASKAETQASTDGHRGSSTGAHVPRSSVESCVRAVGSAGRAVYTATAPACPCGRTHKRVCTRTQVPTDEHTRVPSLCTCRDTA